MAAHTYTPTTYRCLQTLYLGCPDFVLGFNAHRRKDTQQNQLMYGNYGASMGTHVDGSVNGLPANLIINYSYVTAEFNY